jgi:hypothetical protein
VRRKITAVMSQGGTCDSDLSKTLKGQHKTGSRRPKPGVALYRFCPVDHTPAGSFLSNSAGM